MTQEPTPPPAAAFDRDALIEQHRSYARALAIKVMRTLPSSVELSDLVAYGEVGLVEAAERSGSLTTADFAEQLGRPVGAVPGPVTSQGRR